MLAPLVFGLGAIVWAVPWRRSARWAILVAAILLSAAIGSLIAMPLSGMVVTRLGEARTVTVMSLILAVGLATVAVGSRFGAIPVVLGLFLLGFGNGTWDVAMNVQGAAVERELTAGGLDARGDGIQGFLLSLPRLPHRRARLALGAVDDRYRAADRRRPDCEYVLRWEYP